MIWPFSRDRQKDSDGAQGDEQGGRGGGEPAAAPATSARPSSAPAEPKPLLNQDWDPMEAFGPRDGGARNPAPGAMEEP
ncbi:MAG: hypothetical protein EBR45_05945, partial [Betaproteobacteria bacterium]|nr:hypothetical protein [Betaproteobacteria bacterium]